MTDAKLKSYVERIDRLMTTMDETREDIAKVVKEAGGDGYIPKTLRKVAARFHADPDKIATEDALLETYEAALGRVGKALAAIRGGATWNEASEEHDVPRATLARAQAVSKNREMIPLPVEMVAEEPPEVVCTVDAGRPCPNTCAREGRCVWAPKEYNAGTYSDEQETANGNREDEDVHGDGEEGAVCGQPDASDDGGRAPRDGKAGNGRDDDRENGGGLREVGAPQDQLANKEKAHDPGPMPAFLRRSAA